MIRTQTGFHARPFWVSHVALFKVRMSSDDISPSTKPFQAKLQQLSNVFHGVSIPVANAVHDYVDLAKRSLLEHRVRDFTAADVVALAEIMERRDRHMKWTPVKGDDL